jgi:hypothetical protein
MQGRFEGKTGYGRFNMEMDMDNLESHVDVHGTAGVIDCLATICAEKEEHVLCNWQDSVLAREWARAYTILNRAAIALRKLNIPQFGD